MAQIECEIPNGLGPGATFNVEANGQTISVQVPPGTKPGQTIRVALPNAPPVATPVVQGVVHNAPPPAIQAQIVGAEPMVVVPPQPPSMMTSPPNSLFQRTPVNCWCFACGQQTQTRLVFEVGSSTWIICCCIGPLAFCLDFTKDVAHHCGHCNKVIGRRQALPSLST